MLFCFKYDFGNYMIDWTIMIIFIALVSSAIHFLNTGDKLAFTGILFDIIDGSVLQNVWLHILY